MPATCGMATGMQLEPATSDDLDEVHALIERAYRGDSARLGWTHEADLLGGQRTDRESLEAMLSNPAQHLLLYRAADRLLGSIAVTSKGDGLVYIGMVTVEPSMQGGGIGRALLTAAERFAVERLDATQAEMTVIAQREELIAWYERRGYRRTGERRPFPAADPRFGLPKRTDLEFVVLLKELKSPSSVE